MHALPCSWFDVEATTDCDLDEDHLRAVTVPTMYEGNLAREHRAGSSIEYVYSLLSAPWASFHAVSRRRKRRRRRNVSKRKRNYRMFIKLKKKKK